MGKKKSSKRTTQKKESNIDKLRPETVAWMQENNICTDKVASLIVPSGGASKILLKKAIKKEDDLIVKEREDVVMLETNNVINRISKFVEADCNSKIRFTHEFAILESMKGQWRYAEGMEDMDEEIETAKEFYDEINKLREQLPDGFLEYIDKEYNYGYVFHILRFLLVSYKRFKDGQRLMWDRPRSDFKKALGELPTIAQTTRSNLLRHLVDVEGLNKSKACEITAGVLIREYDLDENQHDLAENMSKNYKQYSKAPKKGNDVIK